MSRPLRGMVVTVTRPLDQSRELVALLREAGADVVELPLTAMVPCDGPEVERAVRALAGYDLIVVTSANGARTFAARLAGACVRAPAGAEVVAVGRATASALAEHGITVTLVPGVASADGILRALAGRDLTGTRVLLPRARAGRPELPAGLRAAGAHVDDVAFYDTVACPVDPAALAVAGTSDVIVFTAPSGVAAFTAAGGDGSALRVVTIGPTTSAAAVAAGLTVAAEAAEQSAEGILAAILTVARG